ncbi:MAG: hypothetical protein KCHDKBKB_00691 [Elusimicrobia bacterium]|nr:hypothetical protein [Elusimicrobiota bacterium]
MDGFTLNKEDKDLADFHLLGIIPVGATIDFEVVKPSPQWGNLVKNWSYHTGVVDKVDRIEGFIHLRERESQGPNETAHYYRLTCYELSKIVVKNINHRRVFQY